MNAHRYIAVILALLFSVCSLAEDSTADFDDSNTQPSQENSPGAWSDNDENKPGEQITYPAIKGPKRTVSVGKFTSIGSFNSKYGSWDIGGGLQAMLSKAMIDAGQFIVVERANLQDVLSEQKLKASELTNQETGPEYRQLIGAQFMVYGAVTEFGHSDEGGGLSLGISSGLFGAGLGSQTSKGTMAFDMRVVDTTTGQIVSSRTVKKEIESSGFDASIGYKEVSFGGNKFRNTPLGQASREAITQAVAYIAQDLAITDWKGYIVEVDGREVYINAGQNAGVKTGDNFTVERISKTFTDPTTGEILGTRKKTLGSIQITETMPKMAVGTYTANSAMLPARGDMVVENN